MDKSLYAQRLAEARKKKTQSEAAPKVSGFFEKNDKDGSSWVAKINGLKDDQSFDYEFLNASNVIWQSKKGQTPHGIKEWHLEDGIYKLKLVPRKGDDPVWRIVAVEKGVVEDLDEDLAISIFTGDFDFPPPQRSSSKHNEPSDENDEPPFDE